jgi:hypothetical protein
MTVPSGCRTVSMARRAGTANKGAGNSKRTRKTHRKLIIDKCTSWLFKWSLY